LRVATVASRARAIAAIWQSNWLIGQPSLDLPGWLWPQKFREDVGVQDDHRG
jgi:hypothetical protein